MYNPMNRKVTTLGWSYFLGRMHKSNCESNLFLKVTSQVFQRTPWVLAFHLNYNLNSLDPLVCYKVIGLNTSIDDSS